LIEILLPSISTIEESKHFDIAKQIFKFWNDPATKLNADQINLIKADLKIKCVDKQFRKSTDCIISDHYNNNQLIASWLPNIELANQVAQEYAPRTNQVAEWKNFFALIGCVELTDKQNVFDAKIDFIITAQDELREKHFELLKNISDLHKNKKENGLSFEFEKGLSHIKLQTSNDEWQLPNQIHLSNLYKPKLSLQNDDTINSTLHFLSEKYIPTEIDKYFLTEMGANDSFKFYINEIKRNEIPQSYRQQFEKISPSIVSNAIAGWEKQHKLISHITLNYSNLLTNPKYSEMFLREVQKSNLKHLKFLFEQSVYSYFFGKVPLENYVVYFLKQNATILNQEGELKKPTDLFSFMLSVFITDKNNLPKFDLSEIY